MRLFLISSAVINGARICLTDRTARQLAIKPWGIGFISYFIFGLGAIYAHQPILNAIVNSPTSFWGYFIYYGAWILTACLLLVASMALCLVVVLSLGGIFHTLIAEHVLKSQGIQIPQSKASVTGISKELLRTIRTELFKLIWILPVSVILIILGFIPILTIPVILLGSWLIAYSSFDLVLDALKIPASSRVSIALRNSGTFILYGLTLMACSVIPFVGLFLPPIAVAGAASIYSLLKKTSPVSQ